MYSMYYIHFKIMRKWPSSKNVVGGAGGVGLKIIANSVNERYFYVLWNECHLLKYGGGEVGLYCSRLGRLPGSKRI